MDYSTLVIDGHHKALDRIAGKALIGAWMEAQQDRFAIQQAKALSNAITAMLASPEVQFLTSHTCTANDPDPSISKHPLQTCQRGCVIAVISG